MKRRKIVSKFHIREKLFINIIICLIFVVTIGYATLKTNLGITGSIDVSKVTITAENLTYDNTNTSVNCSNAQCMLNYLANMLK